MAVDIPDSLVPSGVLPKVFLSFATSLSVGVTVVPVMELELESIFSVWVCRFRARRPSGVGVEAILRFFYGLGARVESRIQCC